MFKPETDKGKLIGYSLLHKHAFFFFGTRHLGRDELRSVFPEYEFCFLSQVHGRSVIEADPLTTLQADAHFTKMATRALVSQTADCVPVLLASENQVCAIHSGWRGTAQNIVAACKPSFQGEPVKFAAIGPHIMLKSFEIGKDVAEQLTAANPNTDPNLIRPHADPSKVYFDLTSLVRAQISSAFGEHIKIFECLHDTNAGPEFHSYRRDRALPTGGGSGRQYSFVVINS